MTEHVAKMSLPLHGVIHERRGEVADFAVIGVEPLGNMIRARQRRAGGGDERG